MQETRLGRTGEILFWLVAAAAALRFTDIHIVLRRQNPQATLDLLIDGGAAAPFSERILSPWLIGVLADTAELGRPLVAAGYETLALLALIWIFRETVARRTGAPVFAALAGLSILVPLLVHFLAVEYFRVWYPYDIPAVLAFAAFWWALERRNWVACYLIFVAATLNRETSVFLAMLPLLYLWGRAPATALLLHSAAFGLLWLALKAGAHMFVAPDSLPFQIQLLGNIEGVLARPLDSLQILSVFAFAWVPVLLFSARLGDAGLRRALLIVPVWFAAMALVANLHEIRVFAELVPLVWLAACLLAAGALGIADPASERAG